MTSMLMFVILITLPAQLMAELATPTIKVTTPVAADGPIAEGTTNVVLTCGHADNTATFKFYKGVSEVITGGDITVDATTLTFARFTPADHAGWYTCVVSKSGETSKESQQLNLQVNTAGDAEGDTDPDTVEKPTIIRTPAAGTVCEGGKVELTCASDTQDVTYSFYKDGSTSALTTGVVGGVLTITSFSDATHAGSYTCRASLTHLTFTDSNALALKVVKPTLTRTTPAAGTAVTEGGNVELTCASTTVDVTYTFYKDTSTSALTTGVDGGVLTINPYINATHAGSYTCRASLSQETFSNSETLDLKVGTADGSAGHLKISLLMLALGTLLATIVF